MSLPCMHPVLLNQMIVIISQSFNECFSSDEQAIIGSFLTTLGDMLSYMQNQNSFSINSQDDYDLLEKSVEKIKEELHKIKSNVQK